MATVNQRTREISLSAYPTGDGKPMAETPIHGKNMFALVEILEERYAHDPMVYVSGNMMMYYVPNDKRRHTSPDVFLVKGIPNTYRDAYFVWIEGKGPDVIFEISSASTRKEDTDKKYRLFQDILKVREYFLFDPYEEYLRPSLQGFRLHKGVYLPIKPVAGRLHSKVLGLQMGRESRMLRLYEPATGQRLLTWKERSDVAEAAQHQAETRSLRLAESLRQAEAAQHQAEAASLQLAEKLRQAEAARLAAEQEQENLRRELEELRRRTRKRS